MPGVDPPDHVRGADLEVPDALLRQLPAEQVHDERRDVALRGVVREAGDAVVELLDHGGVAVEFRDRAIDRLFRLGLARALGFVGQLRHVERVRVAGRRADERVEKAVDPVAPLLGRFVRARGVEAVERGRNGRTESPSRLSDALMARPPSGPSTPMRAIALLVAGFAWSCANWTNWLNWALTSSGMAELRVKWLSGRFAA